MLALEEIGVLGASLACLFSLPSIAGEAIKVFGTPDQKEYYRKLLSNVSFSRDVESDAVNAEAVGEKVYDCAT